MFSVERVTTGLDQPLFLTGLNDATGRVFVLEKAGDIKILDPSTGATTTFLSLAGTISTNSERGLLGMALAPDFAQSGDFYLNVTNLAGDTEIRRYTVSAGNSDIADPNSADVVLTISQPASNHNGGWLDFGPDGFLYIATGDGGGSGDPSDFAQNINSLLGKVLRIDVSQDAFPGDPDRDYANPGNNPFVGVAGADEIWALGLRNPFRASFDSQTGDLYIGDVGQFLIEEIDLIPAGQSGLNFGWNDLEGTLPFDGGPNPAFTPPITEYGHGSGPFQGNSVTGGVVYRGPISALTDHYIFGDFASGNIWAIPLASISQGTTIPSSQLIRLTTQFIPDQGSIDDVVSFGFDENGNLYIVDLDGDIFVVKGEVNSNDVIIGDDGANLLVGGPGNDTLAGLPGNDTVLGGEGFDLLYGGDDDDSMSGGTFPDTINGGAGNDTISGGAGGDLILANGGADFVEADGGDDFVNGGIGSDTIFGGDGNDTIQGFNGNDSLEGNAGNDVLEGNQGDDFLAGGVGADTLVGFDGNDTLLGGAFGDVLVGMGNHDSIDGAGGNDLIFLGFGRDTATGGNGSDTIWGLNGGDDISGDGGVDIIRGEQGNDTLLGGSELDVLFGGTENDSLNGGTGGDFLFGGDGNDTSTGGAGADRFFFDGADGADVVTDFEDGVDLIELPNSFSLADVTFTPVAGGLDLGVGNTTVTLLGISSGQIDGNDLIFV